MKHRKPKKDRGIVRLIFRVTEDQAKALAKKHPTGSPHLAARTAALEMIGVETK